MKQRHESHDTFGSGCPDGFSEPEGPEREVMVLEAWQDWKAARRQYEEGVAGIEDVRKARDRYIYWAEP